LSQTMFEACDTVMPNHMLKLNNFMQQMSAKQSHNYYLAIARLLPISWRKPCENADSVKFIFP